MHYGISSSVIRLLSDLVFHEIWLPHPCLYLWKSTCGNLINTNKLPQIHNILKGVHPGHKV
jgi:hypothetical protein